MIHLNFGLFPGSVSGAAAACQGEGGRVAAESVVWWLVGTSEPGPLATRAGNDPLRSLKFYRRGALRINI